MSKASICLHLFITATYSLTSNLSDTFRHGTDSWQKVGVTHWSTQWLSKAHDHRPFLWPPMVTSTWPFATSQYEVILSQSRNRTQFRVFLNYQQFPAFHLDLWWPSFLGESGFLPSRCPGSNVCGTSAPVWLEAALPQNQTQVYTYIYIYIYICTIIG